ncbi:MAG: type II secretion system protein [Sulfurimonas sp.]|uniref:type II secretion system protein n=1 Tax=Sulfurimonas sp. TaxID=2022749 RepID=UPI00260F9E03|nr:type II secretion system protein [Sulfurimonas sp.]MDD2652127.1 type II secretion system protein [Sulfurimonas sp.]MDD3451963.1 type II secretion system protein [Sulfurimonas sp.]
MKRSHAFTVIELIFVIVVLGILASVALPKFAGVREQADIAKGKGDVATIRAAIANNRQKNVVLGSGGSYITAANLDTGGLFGGVLITPMTPSSTSGHWDNNGANGNGSYRYWVGSTSTQFDYNATTGSFGCTSGTYCNQLTN